jgi:hypothetical protein
MRREKERETAEVAAETKMMLDAGLDMDEMRPEKYARMQCNYHEMLTLARRALKEKRHGDEAAGDEAPARKKPKAKASEQKGVDAKRSKKSKGKGEDVEPAESVDNAKGEGGAAVEASLVGFHAIDREPALARRTEPVTRVYAMPPRTIGSVTPSHPGGTGSTRRVRVGSLSITEVWRRRRRTRRVLHLRRFVLLLTLCLPQLGARAPSTRAPLRAKMPPQHFLVLVRWLVCLPPTDLACVRA